MSVFIFAVAVALASVAGDSSAAAALRALGEGRESLECSACELIAEKLYDALDSKTARGFKKWSDSERVKKVSASMRKGCKRLEKFQIATYGDPPKFCDFQEMMAKGGSMSNLNMRPEMAKSVAAACSTIIADTAAALVGRMAAAKRMLDIRLRDELCENIISACPRAEKASSGSSFFSDDDDEL